jgi:hypothetical protein
MKAFLKFFFTKEVEELANTTKRYNQKLKTLQDENYRLVKENQELEKRANTYEIAPEIRGHRYNDIIFPENIEDYRDWLYGELIPTLSNSGKIKGNQFFLDEKRKD